MAKLAQIRLVLDVRVVTANQINEYGRLAGQIAYQVAQEVYRGNVKVDVFLQDGSLFTKITVIGGLLLATYHGAASYPDFKEGIVQLCDDANRYSNLFKNTFLNQTGISENKVVKFTTSTKTPGKIKRLASKLEKLDTSAEKTDAAEIKDKLATAQKDLSSITRDISTAEVTNLKTLLEFHNLPSPSQWPSKSKTVKPISHTQQPLRGTGAVKTTIRKPRLLYHNVFSVPPKR